MSQNIVCVFSVEGSQWHWGAHNTTTDTNFTHFHGNNLQAEIEAQFSELQLLASQRSSRLGESLKLFRFLREADEVTERMGDQMAVAASEDYGYGQDLETIQALVRQHQVFDTDLAAVKEQVCLVSTLVLFTAVQVYI